jgi:hypothetical protein
MKKSFGLLILGIALLFPVFAAAQSYNLSPDDQKRFDSYYTRWLEYQQTNNSGETASMEKRMQDIYAHYRIPSGTPYSRVASRAVRGRGGRQARNLPRLQADDESRFRSYYSRWQEYRRTNNRSETASMEQRMRDVMNKNSVPPDVSYDEMMNSLNGNSGAGRDRDRDRRWR